MKFEWDDYHKYSDGSWHSGSECTVTFDNGKTHILHIDDHTTEKQKEDDKKCYRMVPFAWEMHDTMVFDDCWTIHGLDKNEDMINSPHQYVGTPKRTLEDAKKYYERKFCEFFEFDYEKELEEFMKELDERKRIMDEAMEYKKTLEPFELEENE